MTIGSRLELIAENPFLEPLEHGSSKLGFLIGNFRKLSRILSQDDSKFYKSTRMVAVYKKSEPEPLQDSPTSVQFRPPIPKSQMQT